ncbi:MAG: cobalamin-dependent protein, partial [Deltaproteobacteria bacterium]|nr:cobalamin-dependent protein [Deltaproteobacteria bacterium]
MRALSRLLLVRTNPWKPRTGPYPPLGCLHLASAVRAWLDPGIEIRLADMAAARMGFADLERLYKEFKPDVVGLSSLSHEHADLLEAARLARGALPEALIVAGGPHATMFHDVLAPEPDLDAIVRGEGERTFVELLEAWADGRDLAGVAGLSLWRDGGLVETGERPFEADLDALPPAAWDLLDIPAYARGTNMNGILAASPYMPVMTTRACPYRCVYCHRLFGTKFRTRSVTAVLDELELLRDRYGVREVHFVDDCFNLRRQRALDICRGMVDRRLGYKIAFPNGVRGDRMDEELIVALEAAGAYMITFAV